MADRKIVQAFRVFFEKTVMPCIGQNENVIKEWNHLLKIVGNDPIDYNQLDFYLLLANKTTGGSNIQSPQKSSSNISSSQKIMDSEKFRQSDFSEQNGKINIERKISQNMAAQSGLANKKKSLISNLENFQKLLQSNQQKLQGLGKKDNLVPPMQTNQQTYNFPAQGVPMRRY